MAPTGSFRRSPARSGWFHTGDMATINEDGYLLIVDRKKDIIVSGGENISSLELEKAILAHSAVLEVAVIPVPDAKWGEVPRALVVLKPDAAATEAELIDFCRSRLAHYKCPRSFEFVDALPKTGTGKILKKDLRKKYWQGQETMRPNFAVHRRKADRCLKSRQSSDVGSTNPGTKQRSRIHGSESNRRRVSSFAMNSAPGWPPTSPKTGPSGAKNRSKNPSRICALGNESFRKAAGPRFPGPRNTKAAAPPSCSKPSFWEEMARVEAPPMANSLGLGLIGPTIIAFGTEAQKQRYIPKILSAEEIWCQGFSEPNAGSDLAGLQTEAVLKGDHYIVNGQKVWTSYGWVGNWCELVVRTDPTARNTKASPSSW